MYEELVTRLRERAGANDYDGRTDIACDYEQAADAIEELSRENESLANSVNEASDILRRRWISVEERLPKDGEIVLVYWWNIHCCDRDNVSVMRFKKGRTAEELKDAKFFTGSDQWGNNKKPYKWEDPHGPLSLFGQDVTHWMPLPEPPRGGMSMGVYINGMEMPTKKNGAVLIIYPDGKCAFEDGNAYQAVPVPPHGRLIDADKLREHEFIQKGDAYAVVMSRSIRNAPTIIPASKEGEG